jgi:DHA1 family bicyclomycin/chloramphenicol resistance-like MFS transporter
MFGAMFGFLLSSQQIFTEVFGLGRLFPLAFATVALTMSMSSFLNSRIVGRLGMRRISHGAVIIFSCLALIEASLARLGLLTFVPFMMLLGGIMFLVGLIFSNFNAIAMEPQGKIAGTASSMIGSITTLMATLIGYSVGQAFDGTLIPLSTAHLALGLTCLITIAVTEKGKLFGH